MQGRSSASRRCVESYQGASVRRAAATHLARLVDGHPCVDDHNRVVHEICSRVSTPLSPHVPCYAPRAGICSHQRVHSSADGFPYAGGECSGSPAAAAAAPEKERRLIADMASVRAQVLTRWAKAKERVPGAALTSTSWGGARAGKQRRATPSAATRRGHLTRLPVYSTSRTARRDAQNGVTTNGESA
jgi:hypothetical protein